MIDRHTIDRIMDAANIVDVVSEFVSLRKSGANYKGLCPFHDDRTPSFSVSPSRGIYKCFSCGKAGNVANFIMEHEQLSYPDALRWLARKYHIEIKERELTDEERQQENERESIFIVNEWAATYFNDVLRIEPDGQAVGMAYFRSRGFRDDIIAKFKLGFALPRRTALVDQARIRGYKEEFLVKSGLCVRRDDGSLYDRFAGRVIFPWFGVSGKVTAFGGRLLDARTKGVAQKYVNSPDSSVYHKDHELYGLYQAKKAIAKEDCVYMVEGYTDVISMHQCGIENVVANSGTALSVHQIRLLHRFTSNIVLLYDGDEAGIHAALRGTDMLLAEGMKIKMLLLPDNEDPDSFARKHTAAEFREYIASHQTDFMEFKTQLMLRGENDPIKRSEAIAGIVRSISVIEDQIVRATYIKDCAMRIGIPEQTLINEMNKFIRRDREEKTRQVERQTERQTERQRGLTPIGTMVGTPQADKRVAEIETLLTQLVIRHGGEVILRNVDNGNGTTCDLTLADYVYFSLMEDELKFSNPLFRQIFEEAVGYVHAGGDDLLGHFQKHPNVEVSKVATDLGVDTYVLTAGNQVRTGEEPLRMQTEHLLLDYRLALLQGRIEELKKMLSASDAEEEKARILAELSPILTMRMEIAKRSGKSIIV